MLLLLLLMMMMIGKGDLSFMWDLNHGGILVFPTSTKILLNQSQKGNSYLLHLVSNPRLSVSTLSLDRYVPVDIYLYEGLMMAEAFGLVFKYFN
jgi:hypothetical protein